MPARKKTSEPEVKVMGEYIVADPRICHGALTFRGTRVFVADVLEQVEQGMPWGRIVQEWDGKVTLPAIAEAVRVARQSLVAQAGRGSGRTQRRRAS
jgi:uncharacterized protein (DUF433 family)